VATFSVNRLGQAQFLLSVAEPRHFPADHGREVAFAGRSNAGKSSAINAITGRKALARTSKTPGRTRLLNFFDLGADARLVDLPGYGFAVVSNDERRQWNYALGALRERQSLTGLVLLVDSRRGLQDEDLKLIDWADPTRRRVHVLLTKCDKLKRQEQWQTLASARKLLAGRASVQLFSATDGVGLDTARRSIAEMLAVELIRES
jgi:GTP-binding protein